jgi:hypothetical protein
VSQKTWRARASKKREFTERKNTRKLRIEFVANGSEFGKKPSKNYPNGIVKINKNRIM